MSYRTVRAAMTLVIERPRTKDPKFYLAEKGTNCGSVVAVAQQQKNPKKSTAHAMINILHPGMRTPGGSLHRFRTINKTLYRNMTPPFNAAVILKSPNALTSTSNLFKSRIADPSKIVSQRKKK